MNIKKLFVILCSLFIMGNVFLIQKVNAIESSNDDIRNQIQYTRAKLQQCSSNHFDVMKMFESSLKNWEEHYIRYCTQEVGGDVFCQLLIKDFKILLKAVSFAAEKHVGQYRKDAASTPYIIHPIGVAKSLWEEGGVRSLNVLVAALLHDTLEDTNTTSEEIEGFFGGRIRQTVEELTNDPNLSTDENKQRQIDHARQLSLNAQLVKLADRLYNIRDLRSPPPSWNQDKVKSYLNWGQKLLRELRGTNAALENALEEEIRYQLANSN
jgi:guanosine-3',5'-bis(diphosphate) 3'-pyrophosphohydrolase